MDHAADRRESGWSGRRDRGALGLLQEQMSIKAVKSLEYQVGLTNADLRGRGRGRRKIGALLAGEGEGEAEGSARFRFRPRGVVLGVAAIKIGRQNKGGKLICWSDIFS